MFLWIADYRPRVGYQWLGLLLYYSKMLQQLDRATLLKYFYQFFQYLPLDIIPQEDISTEDLQALYTCCYYNCCDFNDPTYLKLISRNELVKEREQANKTKKTAHKDKSFNTSSQNYTQPQYYGPGPYVNQMFYDSNSGQCYYPQNVSDYEQQHYQLQYQQYNQYNQMHSGYFQNNNEAQHQNNKQFGNNSYQEVNPNQSKQQQQNYYNNQNQGASNQSTNKDQSHTQNPETNKQNKTSVNEQSSSILIQKESSNLTVPSIPAEIPQQDQTKATVSKQPDPQPSIRMTFTSFAELRKTVIEFKDYSNVSEAFKSRVEEINKREPIYQEVRYDKYKKNYPNKGPSTTSHAKPTMEPFQIGGGMKDNAKTQSTPVVIIQRRVVTEEEKETKRVLNESAKNGGYLGRIKSINLTDLKKAEKEIKFNLNLITLENFKAIKKELTKFVVEDQETCQSLISLMIEKAWIQPKFATIYAKLSSEFGKLEKFEWEEKKEKQETKKSKSNPFKIVFIKVVQKFFEDDFTQTQKTTQLQTIPEEGVKDGVESKKPKVYLDIGTIKKKVIGNVRFIGELLLEKVLSKKILYYCTGHLIECFLKQYSQTVSTPRSNELAEIYFEAMIELIEKVGAKFENGEDKATPQDRKSLMDKIEAAVNTPSAMSHVASQEWVIKTQVYFQIFECIDKNILAAKFPRISALLKNLNERRNNNWKSHVVEYKGPMTLDAARRGDEEDVTPDFDKRQSKKDSFDYERQIKKIFQKYDKGKYSKEDNPNEFIDYTDQNAQTDLKRLFKQDSYEVVSHFIRIFGDGSRNAIERRVQLFGIMLELNLAKYDHVKQGWLKNAGKLCYADLPLVAVFFPKLIALVNAKCPVVLEDWKVKTEDQQEQEYVEGVLKKFTEIKS